MENIFKLSHLVLYAKGWYKKTDDIWADLLKILKLDDYTPFDKNDVYFIITNAFQNYKCRQTELREVLINITPNNSWKVGYYTKGNAEWLKDLEKIDLPEYNMETAFIYYVLSTIRFIDNKDWIPVTPKCNKYPRAENITINSIYKHFVEKQLTT